MVLAIALALTLGAATVTDLRRRVIPDLLTAPAAALALAACAVEQPGALAPRLAAGCAAGGLLLAAALLRPGAMGLGDVKLAGVIGLYLGEGAATAMLVALLGGSAAGLALFARHGGRARGMTIPFAPFLALGAGLAALP